MKLFYGQLIYRTSKIFTTRVTVETRFLRSSRTPSTKTSHTYSRGNLRISQQIGKLWNSRLTTVNLSSNKDSDGNHFMNYEEHPFRPTRKISFRDIILETKRKIIGSFMPKGYPDSVTGDYWGFAKWEFIRNVAGSVTGDFIVRNGIGGEVDSCALKSLSHLAATLNWVIKDGLGQLGGVIYAAFINNRFDSEPKRHRFQATVAMQFSSLLELLVPLCPGLFLIVASISNIGKILSVGLDLRIFHSI
ncbi:3531_t:CDS:2, partial [Acaulospora morrowiae]